MYPLDPSPVPSNLDIAVVGSGIAGLSAAWLLAQRHRVVLYEQEVRAGGHSNTVDVPGPHGPVPVDTGFIVYNETTYPNLTALFRHLDVPTKPSNMSFSASLNGGSLEYATGRMTRLFGQPLNLARPRFWRMIRDILRFYNDAPAMLNDRSAEDLTLGEYLDRTAYSRSFAEDHILPLAAAIWSSTPGAIRDYPLHSFLSFFISHGLLSFRNRPQWRTVEGGSREYVNRMVAGLGANLRLGAGVRRVTRTRAGVLVEDASGRVTPFSRIVIAAHADQALAMLGDASAEERRLLGAFGYSVNQAILHTDETLMPKRRRVWSSWNFTGESGGGEEPLCVTYWMNRLQSLSTIPNCFVTLNPVREPRPGTVLRSFEYSHPLFDRTALRAQRELRNLQGQRHTWFCGSYFGYGFHEDALQSGLAAAEAVGGVTRPWVVPRLEMPVALPLREKAEAA